MADNSDPRPGRWLLPLVVLGMMLFTFVFVTRLPGSEATPTTSPTIETTATTDNTTSTDITATTGSTDPILEAYREALGALAGQMLGFQQEMAAVNAAWDATPKQIQPAETRDRLTAVRDDVATWAAAVGQISVPVGLESSQAQIADAANRALQAANDVLDGWVSSPGPEDRRAGAAAFDAAANDFAAAVAAV